MIKKNSTFSTKFFLLYFILGDDLQILLKVFLASTLNFSSLLIFYILADSSVS